MTEPSVTAAVETPAILGECPLWVDVEGLLYWLDIDGRAIHRYDPATGVDEHQMLPGRPGAIVAGRQPGELYMAIENRVERYRWDDSANPLLIANLEPAGTGNRMNDGRTDPVGRFIVGSMWDDPTAGRSTGSLYQVEGSAATTLRTNVGIPNGLAFDPGRGRVYWADTFTDRVIVADYDIDTATWENERTFIDYTDLPGRPDGACVDAEGGYWSASVLGWSVIRVSPEGSLDVRIELPLEKPSMPAFGGDAMDILFVTTIGDEGGVQATPGRDGFVPGQLLAIEGTGATGTVDMPFLG